MSKGAWAYILQCRDDSYYTGSTTFLEQRMEEYQLGIYPGYTSARRPAKLVWVAEFPDIFQAMEVERQIKGWSRKKKEGSDQQSRNEFRVTHLLTVHCS